MIPSSRTRRAASPRRPGAVDAVDAGDAVSLVALLGLIWLAGRGRRGVPPLLPRHTPVAESHGLICVRGAYFWIDPFPVRDAENEVVDVLGLWCISPEDFTRLVAEACEERRVSGTAPLVRWHTTVPSFRQHAH